jgi:hypothetical protein
MAGGGFFWLGKNWEELMSMLSLLSFSAFAVSDESWIWS